MIEGHFQYFFFNVFVLFFFYTYVLKSVTMILVSLSIIDFFLKRRPELIVFRLTVS